jgi:hypothetical protein
MRTQTATEPLAVSPFSETIVEMILSAFLNASQNRKRNVRG